MSKTTAAVLGAVIAGSLIGCAHEGPARYPHGFRVRPYPTPTFTRQPVKGGTTDVLPPSPPSPSPRPSPSRRASRSRPEPTGSFAWANSPFARRVAQCESGGDPRILDSHTRATYFGKWQANADFVRSYDGSNAWSWVIAGRFTMSEARQDAMAYRGFLARGWQPWECAGLVSR